MFDNSLKKDVSFWKNDTSFFSYHAYDRKIQWIFLSTYATWGIQMTLLEMRGQNDKTAETDRGDNHAGWRYY